MEKELVFQILGIEQTQNLDEITSAYRELLKHTNPEDDPEGFKRLRQAYEEAVKFASLPKETQSEESGPKSEVDLWIDRIDEFYKDFLSRADLEGWKTLFSDPICEGLDTSLEAREKLIAYLMDHINLPHKVWKLIDDFFEITENIEELKERFPGNFLNYIKHYVENETFFSYELFQKKGEVSGDCDGDKYINEFYNIHRRIDNNDTEGCLQQLDDLQVYHVYHPYEDVSRLRILLSQGEAAQGVGLAEGLIENYYEYPYCSVYAARILWETGQKERACDIWKDVLEKTPQHYMAKYWTMCYLMEKKEYYDAKEMLMDLLEVNERDEELQAFAHEANEALIEEFQTTLREGREDERLPGDKLILELGWCYIQNRRMEEAEELLKNFTPEEENEYDYVNLYSRLLYHMERYEEAVPYMQKKLEMNCALTDDGTEKIRRRISSMSLTHMMLSYCYEKTDHQKEAYEEAVLAVKTAIETKADAGECLQRRQYLADYLLRCKQYEKAVDACDEILKEDDRYYPAYVVRLECCYEIQRDQQVVNDYHKAVEIYPGYYKPYLFAVKVFYDYRQYEDAKRVIDRARENQVEMSALTRLYEARILRMLANSNEDRVRPMETLKELLPELNEEGCDIQDQSEVPYEIGLLCWDNDEIEEALSWMKEAISQNPGRLYYRMARGNAYLEMKRYEEALEEYKAAEEQYKNSAELYYKRGLVYEGLEQTEEAEENFKRTYEINDSYREVNVKLYQIYRDKFTKYNKPAYYEQALHYINHQISLKENSSSLFDRALLYYRAGEEELAIQDYRKALEYSSDDTPAFNNIALCYRAQSRWEEALKYCQKAKEMMDSENQYFRTYLHLANCYEALKQYDKALEACMEGEEIFPDNSELREKEYDIHMDMDEYDKALECCERMKDISDDYYEDVAWAWIWKGQFEKAVQVMKQGIEEAVSDQKAKLCYELGDMYYDNLDYAQAAEYYKKAISLEEDLYEIFRYEYNLARDYYLMGDKAKAREYAQQALEHLEESGRSVEDYAGYKTYSPVRIGIIGWIHVCLGDREKGEEYFLRMQEIRPCQFCKYKKCYESCLWLGLLYYAMGDDVKAAKLMEEVDELRNGDYHAQRVLEQIRRKL